MDSELTALASSGATTLVGLMVSDAWAQVRGRLAAFFGRGGTGQDAAGNELDVSREELAAARAAGDEEAAADVEAAWRSRLRRALRADPAAAGELRALLDELGPRAAGAAAVVVHNSVSGGVHYGPVIQGQNFSFHSGGYAGGSRPGPGQVRDEPEAGPGPA